MLGLSLEDAQKVEKYIEELKEGREVDEVVQEAKVGGCMGKEGIESS